MRANKKNLVLVPLMVLAGLLLWMFVRNSAERTSEVRSQTPSASQGPNDSGTSVQRPETAVALISELKAKLLGEFELLKRVHGEAEAREVLQKMFEWLEGVPAGEAASAVAAVLQTGEDTFTFGRFSPGRDGFLRSYPTFRTALLDAIEKLDPVQAVTAGKEILNISENMDEWALSLRILARNIHSTEDRDFFRMKVQELLHKDAWLDQPNFSLLHAFDAAVDDGQLQSIERLGELVTTPPNRAVGHAAILSVDRIFQKYSSVGASYLIEHPEFLISSTGFRASLMARVNPMEAQEMMSVESYLASQSFSETEKRTFLLSFPNFNSTFSFNLITEPLLLSRSVMRERSVAVYNSMSAWLAENRYPEIENEIHSAVNRLTTNWKLEL